LFGFVTKHACDRQTDRQTDGQTDGQNYESQNCTSIAASCGKNDLCVGLKLQVVYCG